MQLREARLPRYQTVTGWSIHYDQLKKWQILLVLELKHFKRYQFNLEKITYHWGGDNIQLVQ